MKERRKAIDCELIEESKTSPGYYKYRVTIQELDGTIHKVPAYGVDMQDAIDRLVLNEKLHKVYDSKLINTVFIIFWIALIIFATLLSINLNQPTYVLSVLGIAAIVGLYLNYLDRQANKK